MKAELKKSLTDSTFWDFAPGVRDGPPGVFERLGQQLLPDVPGQPPGCGRVPPHRRKVGLYADFSGPLFLSQGKAIIPLLFRAGDCKVNLIFCC